MKRTIFNLLIVVVFVSCATKGYSNDFEGFWYSREASFKPLDTFLIIKKIDNQYVILETGTSPNCDIGTVVRGLGEEISESEIEYTTDLGAPMYLKYYINSKNEEVIYIEDKRNDLLSLEFYRIEEVEDLDRVIQPNM